MTSATESTHSDVCHRVYSHGVKGTELQSFLRLIDAYEQRKYTSPATWTRPMYVRRHLMHGLWSVLWCSIGLVVGIRL